MSQQITPMTRHLHNLVGKTVTSVCMDDSPETLSDFHQPVYGLRLSDGSFAWIMADPEGNGPGFLDIQKD